MSWPTAKLSDVAPAQPLKKIERLDNDNVLQITLDHIESDSGRLLKSNYAPVSEAGSSTHWFDNRYVLYSKLRPYLNKVYLPDELGIGTTELVPMLPNDKVLDRKYLAYFLRSKTFVGWVSSQTAGAKMPRVSMKVFWDYEIPLPPLAEQKRIAAILDKADNLRRKRQQAIQLADDFLRSVFLDMFGDPVTNPKGWEVRPLGESIAHANNGLSRRRKEFENLGEIVLRLQDVHYEGIHFDKVLNRIQLDTSEKQRFLVNEGDILFIRVNGNPDYVGRSSVFEGYTEDVYHNDHLIRIKVGGGYDPIFLSYCFNHEGGRKIIAGQIKTSAGQHTISQGGIGKLAFYLPPLTLQQRFVSIRNAVKSIPVAGDLPQDLFACLSQKAFAGEL